MSVIDQKRIAGNTLMLYLRMGLMLFISLYTSRVILDVLGEEDFGIYNAVGGIVAMFSFVSGTLSTACQRFFLVELGKGGGEPLRRLFSLCLLVFAAFAAVVIIAGEPAGLWLLQNKMNVGGRMAAAKWVFHFSVLSFVAVVLRLPYQGMVISREKMKVFAYISIFEALAALVVALSLSRSSADHLILYAALMFATQVVVTLLYVGYCLRFYSECRYSFYWDRSGFKELFSFAGWNMIGASAAVFKVHGVNLLLNMFFGPVVNAARGMAFKVYGSIIQLQENFMLASRPQIIKSYSAGEYDGMTRLIWQSSKFSAYLMLLVAVPVILEMDFLLSVWLKEVPQYTAVFATLMLVNALIDYIDYPVQSAIQAKGDMKRYQISVGLVQLLVLPVAYVMFKAGNRQPQSVLYVSIAISVVAVAVKLHFGKTLVGLSPWKFLCRAVLPVIMVAAVTWAVGYAVRACMVDGWVRLAAVTGTCVTVECICVLLFGMTDSERKSVFGRLLRSR